MRGYIWLSLSILLLLPAVACGQVRKWTTRSGDLTVEGELLDVTGGNVVLKKADGTSVSVALDRLSLLDLRYVQQVLQDATAAVRSAPAASTPAASTPAANAPAANAPAAVSPTTASLPPNQPASNPPASVEGGPPLTRANSSRWQVAPDPPSGVGGDSARITAVSISLPGGLITGELCLPATPSPFMGYASTSSPLSFVAWDLRNGDRFGPVSFEGYSLSSALSPDGGLVALGGNNHTRLQLWSLKDRTLALEIDVGERFSGLQTLAFASPTRLLVGSRSSRGLLRVFDTGTGKEIAKIAANPPHEKHALGISPGGHYVAFSSDYQQPVRLYDLRNGELAGELEIPGGGGFRVVKAVAFSPDGGEVAVLIESQGLGLYCWSLETGKLTAQHKFERSLEQLVDGATIYRAPPLEFIPREAAEKGYETPVVDGWLVCGRAVIDRAKGGPIWVAKTANRQDQRGLRKLLDAERQLVVTGDNKQLQISIARIPWKEIHDSAAVVERGGTPADSGLPGLTKAVIEGAAQVAIPSPPPAWSAPVDPAPAVAGLTVEPIAIAPTAQIGPRWLLATAAAKAVIAVRADNDSGYPYLFKYRRFDLKTGHDDGEAAPGFKTELHDVSPDGSRIVVGAAPENERLDIYDLASGKHIVGLRPFTVGEPSAMKLRSAALVTNDRLLTVSSGGKLVLWSLPDCRAVYQCDALLAQRIVPLSHGRKVMLLEADGVLCAHDAATAQPLGALESVDRQPGEFLQAFEFSPDGRAVAVLFRHKTKANLVVWSLETGKLLHRHALATGWDLTWVDSTRLLIHHPLEISRAATGPTYPYAPLEVPPRRYDLFDLGLGRKLWRYQLSRGEVSSQSLDGRTWFLAAKDYREPAKLQGLVIPGRETARAIAEAPPPKNLLPRNTAVTLDLTVKISGDPIADQALSDAVRKQLSEVLSKRGLKVQERSSLALRIELRERLTGRWLELRPILGGIAGTYQVKGTELECTAMLADVTGKSLWKEQQVIEVRQELPQAGLPQGVPPNEFVRQQQWNDALKWLTTSGIPAEILEGWAYAGMGESVLSPAGESRLVLDAPAADPGKSQK